ncbi:hypothetical protein R5R35_010416 [Gryllus longicercus]|uniref:Uracil-DNA glycosylase-like domain-containing protein n=1 Tax=Gryllus longicercus TaxID=2509291 RepID=A0AAN9VK95_9ORTH
MFLGMNPGPWGMSQTGVPFGEVNIVREWLGITGEVGRPKKENPARPVLGFACSRSEISGQRFWGLFKDLCGEARNFFENTLIYNHCPVAFMTESGKNITPNELKERKAVTVLCDKALFEIIVLYNVSIVIAIGRFAEKRATTILKSANKNDVKVICIPHPSPRNFGTAEKWREIVIGELEKNALMQYFKRSNDITNLTTSGMLPGSSSGHGTKQVEDCSVLSDEVLS